MGPGVTRLYEPVSETAWWDSQQMWAAPVVLCPAICAPHQEGLTMATAPQPRLEGVRRGFTTHLPPRLRSSSPTPVVGAVQE